ncbi:MAG: HAD-IA family hydrolase [Armatimonadetes bacterium]|nr:HAD-IA family hydrolase [Armatimonadota bacterium]
MRSRPVCFDLGGVLVDIRHTWDDALVGAGLEPTGRTLRLSECPLLTAYQAGGVLESDYLEALADLLEVTKNDARRTHTAILREEFEGMDRLIVGLQERGLVTGCLSNTNALHWDALVSMSAIGRLQVRVASHLCGANKPDAASFAAFETAAGVSPDEVVFFDDGAVNVEAARRRGWAATLVTAGLTPFDQVRTALRLLDLL